jgi:hypothetical protein
MLASALLLLLVIAVYGIPNNGLLTACPKTCLRTQPAANGFTRLTPIQTGREERPETICFWETGKQQAVVAAAIPESDSRFR